MTPKIVDIHTHKTPCDALTLSSHGVHPYDVQTAQKPLRERLYAGVEAVGEIGLDRVCGVDMTLQQQLFEEQLDIAQRLDKIVVIHCVRAYSEVISTLDRYTLPRVIFHGFIGSAQLMEEIVRRGYYISFGHRTLSSPKTIEALRHLPLDRLFIESDESDMPIEEIYTHIAALLGTTQRELIHIIYNNYKKIIR